MATVSVIIPCYNYGAFLRGCAESVLSQEGVDVHVLIIDDASSDTTAQVAGQLVGQDARVQFRRHEANKGHIATYNEGLRWASGDYTMLLSADDMLTPGALERAARVLDAHPEAGLLYGGTIGFSTDRPLPAPRVGDELEWEIMDGLDWFKRTCRTAENGVAAPGVVVRTSLQHRLGGYRVDLPHSGDMEMWLRFALHAPVARITNADLAFFRGHAGSMQKSRFGSPLTRLQQREAAWDVLFHEYGDRIPDPERLRRMVDRALAADALWTVCRAACRRQLGTIPAGELLDFAVRTRRGQAGRGRGDPEVPIRLSRELPRLLGPFLDGAWRWPRGWLKARRRALVER
jgi:glycosyltransferase involved in cell wall biosynthesis